MIFSKFFHLSREGSKTIMQAGIWLAVFNLAALLPAVLLAMVSESMMTKHFAGDGGNIPLSSHWLCCLSMTGGSRCIWRYVCRWCFS